MSAECQSLIAQLLNPDFTRRLGAKGVDEIKNHPFFQGSTFKTNSILGNR